MGTQSEYENKLWRINEWFPELSEDARRQLRTYHVELITFNRAINLISNRSEENADLVHFADCVLGCQLLLKSCTGPTVYDFGSGNGLPGIVLAILAPEFEIRLVESDARKVEFLKHVANRIGLPNVTPLHMRAEDVADNSVQWGVSRGFASISKSLLFARKAFQVGGQYFHFKSESWVREVADIPSQMCRFWVPMLVDDYSLPVGNVRLSIVVTKKVG